MLVLTRKSQYALLHCSWMTKMFIIHSCVTYYYLHALIHMFAYVYMPPTFFVICIPSNDLPTIGADTLVCVRISCSLSRLRRTALVCLSLIRAGAAGLA